MDGPPTRFSLFSILPLCNGNCYLFLCTEKKKHSRDNMLAKNKKEKEKRKVRGGFSSPFSCCFIFGQPFVFFFFFFLVCFLLLAVVFLNYPRLTAKKKKKGGKGKVSIEAP
eukprot:TRINITY_DN9533_c0_g2_i1.p1 TRINITY_DN9533_c0_g2~~TRINITY_DN9533_c0_g2_i1.p1  ORF type:complete len:111 (+),score=2.90 TRINITY_DN9533_c0_g2_i1:754-1086(+)